MASCNNNSTLLDDMPDLDVPEWHDDFIAVLDSIDAEELRGISSLSELGLHLSLHGFSREEEFTEVKMWQGLFMWAMNASLVEDEMRISVDALYGKDMEETPTHVKLAEQYQHWWVKHLFIRQFMLKYEVVKEFCSMKYEDRRTILDALERVKNGDSKMFNLLICQFTKQVAKYSVPEVDETQSF